MQFGSIRPVTGFKGAIRCVGQRSLHVQCDWILEQAGSAVATQADLFEPDEKAHCSPSASTICSSRAALPLWRAYRKAKRVVQ